MNGEPIPLIKEDGTPFSDEEVASLSAELDALDDDARVEARNENALPLVAIVLGIASLITMQRLRPAS